MRGTHSTTESKPTLQHIGRRNSDFVGNAALVAFSSGGTERGIFVTFK